MSHPVKFIEQNGVIFIEFPHQLDVAELTVDELDEAYRKSDLSRAKVFEGGFHTALSEVQKYRVAEPKSQQNLRYKVAEIRPATLTIHIADDAMEAEASVTAPYGGEALKRSDILNQLREANVIAGIRRVAIDQLVEHSETALPGLPLQVIIARGRQPVHGLDARFKPLVQDARKRILKPKERGDGSVDMRDLGKHFSVKVGDAVLRKLPATKGRAGFTVVGDAIEAKNGEDKVLKEGTGTTYNPNDNDELIAAKQGMPTFNESSADIDEVLTIENVDVGTGHVDYEGSVIVTGSVAEGMRVKATGDITIAGYVDSAELNAGGHITVAKGVIGHQLSYDDEDDDDNFPPLSTRIIAGGSIWLSYAQYAMLIGKSGVIVDKQLTHCHVITQGALCVGGEGRNAVGKVIGGVVETTGDVFTGQLGAPAGTKTRVYFQNSLEASAEELELASLKAELSQRLTATKKLLQARERVLELGETERGQQLRHKIHAELTQQQNHIIDIRNRLTVLLAEPAAEVKRQIVINRQLYPGAIARYEDKFLRVKERRSGTLIELQQYDFIMDILR